MRQFFRSSLCFAAFFVLSSWTCRGAEPPDAAKPRGMLIVAPERFHEALKPYLAFREHDRPVEFASLEGILEQSPGSDDPERLKRRLFKDWKAKRLRYVLLVGDADILPVRYMVLDRVTPAAFDYAFYPSDLYYADIADRNGDFDDWNAMKEGFHANYYGEVRGEKNKSDPINFDRIDYRPELAVGRWPVSTARQVMLVAEKTMAYEKAILSGKRGSARTAAFVYIPGWVDARGQMDRWAGELPKGWSSKKLYASPGKGGERLVEGALNQGASLVFHAGHGEDSGWHDCIHVGSLKSIHNADRLPVVLSAGCSTARFATLPPYEAYEDIHGKAHKGTNSGEVFTAPPPPPAVYAKGAYNMTGLGERMVRDGLNGAVGYIGCNTGGQPCGLTLLEGFVKGLEAHAQPTLGDCWASAIDHYYEAEKLATIKPNQDWYPPSIFFQGMKYMVFGDPALALARPEGRIGGRGRGS